MSEEYQDAQIADLKREMSDLRAKFQSLLEAHRADQMVALKELQAINLSIVKLDQKVSGLEKWQEKAGGVSLKALGVVLGIIIVAIMGLVIPGGVDR